MFGASDARIVQVAVATTGEWLLLVDRFDRCDVTLCRSLTELAHWLWTSETLEDPALAFVVLWHLDVLRLDDERVAWTEAELGREGRGTISGRRRLGPP